MSERQEDTEPDGAERRTKEALFWFTQMQGARISEADRAAFEAWRAADSRNDPAFRRVVAFWGSPEFAAALGSQDGAGTRRGWRRVQYAAAAASILFCVLVAGPASDAWRVMTADYRTAVGMTTTVRLKDGSLMKLNTATAASVDMGSDYRRVRLFEGEGYFDVTHDADRPFEVDAGTVQVRILGTAFTVQHDGERVLVGVRRGSVSVHYGAGTGEDTRLAAGELLQIAPDEPAKRRRFDADTMLAWLDGRIVFRDKPLGAVLQQVDRYHAGWIFLAGGAHAEARVSGSFRLDDPDAIVDSLARAAAAKVVRLPGGLVIVH
jgi:transmembrane sensor